MTAVLVVTILFFVVSLVVNIKSSRMLKAASKFYEDSLATLKKADGILAEAKRLNQGTVRNATANATQARQQGWSYYRKDQS